MGPIMTKWAIRSLVRSSAAPPSWSSSLEPWPERPVFWQVRYMNAKGLERKFDMTAYLRAVDDLIDAERR